MGKHTRVKTTLRFDAVSVLTQGSKYMIRRYRV